MLAREDCRAWFNIKFLGDKWTTKLFHKFYTKGGKSSATRLAHLRSNLVEASQVHQQPEREFFIDNLLVRIHFIIVMIRWTGLCHPAGAPPQQPDRGEPGPPATTQKCEAVPRMARI